MRGLLSRVPLGPDRLAGAKVVLPRLPRSLDALDEIAALIAAHADPDVTIYTGGMVKHPALAMNEVLDRYFASLRAVRAWQKARVTPSSRSQSRPVGDIGMSADQQVVA